MKGVINVGGDDKKLTKGSILMEESLIDNTEIKKFIIDCIKYSSYLDLRSGTKNTPDLRSLNHIIGCIKNV